MASAGQDNPAYQKTSDETGFTNVVNPDGLNQKPKVTQSAMTRDICFVSLSFFFLFTSYQSMSNLQSTMNATLGTVSMSVLYAAMVLSSAFVPTWMIGKLGVRNTIALCMLGYSTYVAAQFYPSYYTLVPTAALLGLAASPLWSAKCTYLTHVGKEYSVLSGETSEVVITRFFGIFFLFFQSTQIVGNLISSLVLTSNATRIAASDSQLDTCGVNFCQSEATNITEQVSAGERYTMSAIYLGFSLVSSIVVIISVSPLTRYGEKTRVGSSTGRSPGQQLMATFRHMSHPYQLLVAPLTVWSGLEQAFLSADYTAAYVSCGLGVHMIGYTMICFGVCNAVCSYFCSSVVIRVGRIPLFSVAAAINVAVICVLFHWRPTPDQPFVFFVVPALWGVADAVWLTQINALYGVLFPEETEAAFSNHKLWTSLGFIGAYVCSSLMCVTAKINILITSLILGIVGYATIELMEWRARQQKRKVEK